jgi:hypothetical protein
METFNKEKYISLDEAADYLGIKPVTLRGWIKLVDFGNLNVLR